MAATVRIASSSQRWLVSLAVLFCAACGSTETPSTPVTAVAGEGGLPNVSGGPQTSGAPGGAGGAPVGPSGDVSGGTQGWTPAVGAGGLGGTVGLSSLIVDTHTHFWDLSRAPGFSDGKNELPDGYAATAKPAGISGAILVEAVWQTLADNRWGLELARQNPVVVGVIGRLVVGSASFRDDLATLAADPHFRGLRVGASELTHPDLTLLAERNLIAEVDVAGSVAALQLVAEEAPTMPQLKIVIEHAGGLSFAGAPSRDLSQALVRAARAPNVYCKVSRFQEQAGDRPAPTDTAAYAAALDFLLEAFGQDRLLFGSNWPLSEGAGSLQSAVDIMQGYWRGKEPEAARKFFSGNATALYQISVP